MVRTAIALVALGAGGAGLAQAPSELSLDQALRMALANNLDLVSARINPSVAEQQVVFQQATFDPVVELAASRSETSRQPIDPTQPQDRTVTDFSATVNQQLKFGGRASGALFVSENDAPGFNLINPRYDAGLTLAFDMPLLGGRGREVTTEALLLARRELEISWGDLQQQAALTLETVEGAYWDVLAARQALDVERQALERAEDLLVLNRKKVEVGTLAPIEITQAEAGVASQVEQVLLAEVALENAEDELLRLLAVPSASSLWSDPVVLVDRPVFVPVEVDLERAIEEALRSRPEMAAVQQRLQNRELSERVARRGLRHDLDLNLRYTALGDNDNSLLLPGPDMMFGTIDDVFLPSRGSTGDAFSEIPENENYTWTAGLTYRLPIGNRADRATYRIAQLSREQAEVAVEQQELTIRVEVRAAAREVESAVQRVEAAQKNVELQREKLEAEQKKFENGMSTSFEVLTFQNDLADAELSLIRAQLDYLTALAGLQRAQGTLLASHGLALARETVDPGEPRSP